MLRIVIVAILKDPSIFIVLSTGAFFVQQSPMDVQEIIFVLTFYSLKQFVHILLCFCFPNTVLSQQCYNQPNCTGDVVSGVTTAKECCVGTDDGMSFGVSGGSCTVSQCIGN